MGSCVDSTVEVLHNYHLGFIGGKMSDEHSDNFDGEREGEV